jgi:hypothetical protein
MHTVMTSQYITITIIDSGNKCGFILLRSDIVDIILASTKFAIYIYRSAIFNINISRIFIFGFPFQFNLITEFK